MTVRVEKLRRDHLPPIADDIRSADLREWAAGTGSADIIAGLEPIFEEDRYARCLVDHDGKMLCAWGVDPMPSGAGWVWLFATNAAPRHVYSSHRHLHHQLHKMLLRWGTLVACADGRNTVHHHWLRWLGFSEVAEINLGPWGMPFKKFIKEV